MTRKSPSSFGLGSSKCASVAKVSLFMTLLVPLACDQDEPVEVDDPAAVAGTTADAPVDEVIPDDVEVIQREPELVLDLGGGASLGFLIDEDGSIGLFEQVPTSAGIASVLDDPWLKDASPAVIWYALTKDGMEIPEPLRAHHEALAVAGELPPLEQALAGQIRDLAPIPLADDENPCLNANFDVNHCDNPDYEDSLCFFNTNGNWTWNVAPAARYKAGFCLQEGEARSWLRYAPGAGPIDGECIYYKILTYIWGGDSDIYGVRYSAPTYFTYVWWAGVNTAPRSFSHRVIGDPGAVFDWGNRWTAGTCD